RKAFFHGALVLNWLGALTLLLVLISATRLDQVILQAAHVTLSQAESNQIGQALTGAGVLLGAAAIWWARSIRNRGYLRAWTRYSVTAQTLRVYENQIESAWARFAALEAPTADDRKSAIEAITKIGEQAKDATLNETKLWATDTVGDLGEYINGA